MKNNKIVTVNHPIYVFLDIFQTITFPYPKLCTDIDLMVAGLADGRWWNKRPNDVLLEFVKLEWYMEQN